MSRPGGDEASIALADVAHAWSDRADLDDQVPSDVAARIRTAMAEHRVLVVVCDDEDAHRAIVRATWTAGGSTRLEVDSLVVQVAVCARETAYGAPAAPELDAEVEGVEVPDPEPPPETPALVPAADPPAPPPPDETERKVELILTLDLLASCDGEAGAVLLVWATDAAAAPFLSFVGWEAARLEAVAAACVDRSRWIVVLASSTSIPQERRPPHLERIRPLRWELDTLVTAQPELEVQHDLAHLLRSCFSVSVLREFLQAQPDVKHLDHLDFTRPAPEVCNAVTELLFQLGVVTPKLFDDLRAALPGRATAIEACRTKVAARCDFDGVRREQITRELAALTARSDEPTWPPLLDVDPVEIMLHGRLSPAQRRVFIEQWHAGEWGTSTLKGIRALRTTVRRGADGIREAFSPRTAPNDPSDDDAQVGGQLDLLVRFVAAFLPGLNPDEFDEVLRGLIELEQTHLDEVLPPPPVQEGETPAPERSLLQEWVGGADEVIERCGLEVHEVGTEGARYLEVGWRSREQARWTRFLQKRRHYFVARQVDHLREFRFLTIQTTEADTAFARIMELQFEQATLSPQRHIAGWIAGLGELVDHLVRFLATERQRLENAGGQVRTDADRLRLSATYQTWAGQLVVKRRLLQILQAMQGQPSMQPFVKSFYTDLMRRKEPSTRVVALTLVVDLASMSDFNPMAWLRQLYCSGGVGIMPQVIDATVAQASAAAPEQRRRAWNALDEWFADDIRPEAFLAARPQVLAFTVIMNVVRRLACPIEGARLFDTAVGDWLRAPVDEVPAPVRWVTDPHAADLAERFWGAMIELCVRYAVRPPWNLEPTVLQATFDTFDAEIELLLSTEVEDRREAGKRWFFPPMLASVVTLWQLRAGPGELPGIPLVLGRLGRPALLEVSGSLSALTEAVRAGQGAFDGDAIGPVDEPLADFYPRQLDALASVRAAVEAILIERTEDSDA